MEYRDENFEVRQGDGGIMFGGEYKVPVNQEPGAEVDAQGFHFAPPPREEAATAAAAAASVDKTSGAQSPHRLPSSSWDGDAHPMYPAANAIETTNPTAQEATNGGGNATEVVRKHIETRTASIDANTREKETSIKAAAESYMKEDTARREKRLKEVKTHHAQEQRKVEERQSNCKKSGDIWKGVSLVTDLGRANKYSKNTERMRSILNHLSGTNNT